MFKCESCDHIFEYPDEKMNILVTDPYPMGQSIGVCPECGCDEFIEAVQCPDCGDYYAEGSLVLVELEDGTETEVCPYCYEDNYFIPQKVNKEEV